MTQRAREYEELRDKVFFLFENPNSTQEEKRYAIKMLNELYNSLRLEDHTSIRPMTLNRQEKK